MAISNEISSGVRILESGNYFNASDSQADWMPLHRACFDDNVDIVKSLVLSGADIDAINSLKCGPETVEFLLQNKADCAMRDIHGWTALK